MRYQNPVISGMNPDPSVCRVGEDFYLVTSTFEFFPGVPIYHSKNLISWEHIGYCLTRDSQLPLEGCGVPGGIFAPTLRYHDGMFYMVTTNVTGGWNFVVHAKNILGPWSEPAWINQGGIDPSLLFDDDGTVYYCTNGPDEATGTQGIQLSEINPLTGEILRPAQIVLSGVGRPHCRSAPSLPRWGFLLFAHR